MSLVDHAERLPAELWISECEAIVETSSLRDDKRAADLHRASLLRVQAVVVGLPGRRFGPFDLAIAAGERIAVLGTSGAGKSTLLKLMAGERAPLEGTVRLDGRPLQQWPLKLLARRRAVLPQSHAVAFGLPVALVVSLGRVARESDPALNRIVHQALQLAQAEHLLARRFDTLSGGEQARVQLARVFAQLWDEQEALVLVDEPLAALDPGLQFELMDAMLSFTRERGHALVAVLHDINQALNSFQRLWLMQHGRVLSDEPSGRSAVERLEALYGIRLRCFEDGEGGWGVVPIRRDTQKTSQRSAESRPLNHEPQ